MNRHQRRKAEAMRPRNEAGGVPSEDLELFWSLVAPAKEDERMQGGGPYYSALRAAMGANRFVLTKEIMDLAEDLRISDLSVTINSLDKALPFPGRSWFEWNAGIAGRLPPSAEQASVDRVGVLIDADETGHRGTINVLSRFAQGDRRVAGLADISPVAITFDLREAYERPQSLVEPASASETRRYRAAVQNPTPAEMEGSSVVSAALGRRFGVIESPYLAPFMGTLGADGQPWHEVRPDLFQVAINEAMSEVALAMCAFIVMRTVGIERTQVLRGTKRKTRTFGFDTTPLSYGIFNVAA